MHLDKSNFSAMAKTSTPRDVENEFYVRDLCATPPSPGKQESWTQPEARELRALPAFRFNGEQA